MDGRVESSLLRMFLMLAKRAGFGFWFGWDEGLGDDLSSGDDFGIESEAGSEKLFWVLLDRFKIEKPILSEGFTFSM